MQKRIIEVVKNWLAKEKTYIWKSEDHGMID